MPGFTATKRVYNYDAQTRQYVLVTGLRDYVISALKRVYVFSVNEDETMAVSSFSKFTSESFTIRMDFSPRMPAGRTLAASGSVVRAINLSTGVDDQSTVLVSATPVLDVPNNFADVNVQAGSVGTKYRLEFEIGLDSGGPIEDHVMMEIV